MGRSKPPSHSALPKFQAGDWQTADVVEIWKKTIDVQQHFNDLEMRIRNFALTLLVGILGGTALAVKEGFVVPLGGLGHWSLASLLLLIGAVCWSSFWFLDRRWYHRLLVGAVEHGRAIEDTFREQIPAIGLTEAITAASRIVITRWLSRAWHILAFATMVFLAVWGFLSLLSNYQQRMWHLILLGVVSVLVTMVLRALYLPKWEMKARIRLDLFYGSILVTLLLLSWAANVATSPVQAQASGTQSWRAFIFATDRPRDRRELAFAPAFSTLRACLDWAERVPGSREAVAFECALGCQAEPTSKEVTCVDTTGRMVIASPVTPRIQTPIAPSAR